MTMERIDVHIVTLPVLIPCHDLREADGRGTFLPGDQAGSMFVHAVTQEDVKGWQRKAPAKDFSLFIGATQLKQAYDDGDDFALAMAHEKLSQHARLAPLDDIKVELKTKDGAKISLHAVQKWNATQWNYSGLMTEMVQGAKLVMWHPEEERRFLPALYCSDMKTAAFAMSFTKQIRVCPWWKCNALFVGNKDYCCVAHREAHRVARFRWRDKQAKAAEGPK
jgi:hypothetical protein